MGEGVALENFDIYTYEGSPNVTVAGGFLVLFLSVILFSIINYIAYIYGPPKTVTGDPWRWRNTFVSWVHALVVGLGVVYCSTFYPETLEEKVIYCDYLMYSIVAISLGYFVYDLLDLVVNNRLIINYEIVLHHLWVIVCFGYNVVHRVYLPYNIIALMVEVNSIFLHARKLMQLQKWSFDHWQYRLIVFLNLVTFVLYRMYGVTYLAIDLPFEWKRLTTTHQILMSGCMIVLSIINCILFWRILKNDVLRRYIGSKSKASQNGHSR